MKENILTKEVGGKGASFSILSAGLTSLSKEVVVDGVATPLMSKLTKGNKILNVGAKILGASIVGYASNGASNKYVKEGGKIVADSMVLSAGDEIVQAFIGKKPGVKVSEGFVAGDDSFGGSNKANSESSEVFI